jgi:hypothetical protein
MTLIDTRSGGQANVAMDKGPQADANIVISFSYFDKNVVRLYFIDGNNLLGAPLQDPSVQVSITSGENDLTLTATLGDGTTDANDVTKLEGFSDIADGTKLLTLPETQQTVYTNSVTYWPTSMNM